MSIDTQTAIILDAMGLSGPEISGPSKMRAVASVVEELDRRLQKAIREGRQPRDRMAQFREGLWPSRKQLAAMVQDIDAKAKAMQGAV